MKNVLSQKVLAQFTRNFQD